LPQLKYEKNKPEYFLEKGESPMAKKIVLGIMITNRVENAPRVQKLLTDYGCNIKTRLGLHDVNDTTCSTAGLILMELFGDESTCLKLEKQLREAKGIQVQKMLFET
jgi:hypothetical protein